MTQKKWVDSVAKGAGAVDSILGEKVGQSTERYVKKLGDGDIAGAFTERLNTFGTLIKGGR